MKKVIMCVLAAAVLVWCGAAHATEYSQTSLDPSVPAGEQESVVATVKEESVAATPTTAAGETVEKKTEEAVKAGTKAEKKADKKEKKQKKEKKTKKEKKEKKEKKPKKDKKTKEQKKPKSIPTAKTKKITKDISGKKAQEDVNPS